MNAKSNLVILILLCSACSGNRDTDRCVDERLNDYERLSEHSKVETPPDVAEFRIRAICDEQKADAVRNRSGRSGMASSHARGKK